MNGRSAAAAMADIDPGASDPRRGGFWRLLASAVAALAVHAVLFLALPAWRNIEDLPMREVPPGPLSVQLEERVDVAEVPRTSDEEPKESAEYRWSADSGQAAAASQGIPIDDFVIPTPKASGDSLLAEASRGPSFTASEAKTGVTASAADANAYSEPRPDLLLQSGSQAATASDAGLVPQGGKGVLVSGQPAAQAPSGADLGNADRSSEGTRTVDTGSAGAQQGQGSADSREYSVVWDEPDASKGRSLVSAPKPKIPSWVSAQGLSLSATITFTLTPDGVVSMAQIELSTGYSDVDFALIDAIRKWRFTSSRSTRVIKGTIPWVISAQ